MIRRGKWTIDTRSTALYAIAWNLVIVLFAFLHRRRRDVKWLLCRELFRTQESSLTTHFKRDGAGR
jgi:hypothetical protein